MTQPLHVRRSGPSLRLTTLALLACPTSLLAVDIDSTWVGPAMGSWNAAANWIPVAVPNNGGGNFYSVFILSGALVTIDTSVTASNLALGGADHLRIPNSRVLTIAAGAGDGLIENAGLIELAAGANSTRLDLSTDLVTLTGGGTVRLGAAEAWIRRANVGGALFNVDNVIEGAGRLSWTSAPTPITNQHLIRANGLTPLIIQPGAALFTNQGTLRAEDGATLRLNAGTYLNTGGTIEAMTGSTVELDGNALVTGGSLSTAGDGAFVVTNITPRVENLPVAGSLLINNGRTLFATGALHNSGEIVIGSTGSNTYLRPVDGALVLNEGSLIADGAAQLRFAPDATDGFVNDGSLSRADASRATAGSPATC